MTPAGRGFDTSFGFLGGFETYDTHMMWNGRWNLSRQENGAPNGYVGPYISDLYETDHAATDAKYNGTCTAAGVCTCADGDQTSNVCRYSSYMYIEKSMKLIEKAAKQSMPAFYYFAIQSVHSPYQISSEYLERFPHLPTGSMARRMHAMVAALDDFIGNTTEMLRNTHLWENSLYILHADNVSLHCCV
jgi:arylsulfatase A-like enzyme